jgi:hypothetical protein
MPCLYMTCTFYSSMTHLLNFTKPSLMCCVTKLLLCSCIHKLCLFLCVSGFPRNNLKLIISFTRVTGVIEEAQITAAPLSAFHLLSLTINNKCLNKIKSSSYFSLNTPASKDALAFTTFWQFILSSVAAHTNTKLHHACLKI